MGCFLFTDDDVFKKIKVLSGGEKSRVALAKTLISEANFLLLDEPTNHLDFISENILIQALQQYQGSFVVVSHNRHFVNQVANKIWYIENYEIKEYPGTYEEYEYWRKQNTPVAVVEKPVKKEKPVAKEAPVDSNNTKKTKALQQELSKVEDSILKLEAEKQQAEAELAKPEIYSNPSQLEIHQAQFTKVEAALKEATRRWEEIVNQMESLG